MRIPSLLIRPAAESDAEAIGRVHFHAWQETYTGLLPGEIMSHLSEERSVGIFRREGCRNIFVAVLEEETVGFCGYGPWRGEAPSPTPGEVVGCMCCKSPSIRASVPGCSTPPWTPSTAKGTPPPPCGCLEATSGPWTFTAPRGSGIPASPRAAALFWNEKWKFTCLRSIEQRGGGQKSAAPLFPFFSSGSTHPG